MPRVASELTNIYRRHEADLRKVKFAEAVAAVTDPAHVRVISRVEKKNHVERTASRTKGGWTLRSTRKAIAKNVSTEDMLVHMQTVADEVDARIGKNGDVYVWSFDLDPVKMEAQRIEVEAEKAAREAKNAKRRAAVAAKKATVEA